jgi:hypothetical protein
VDLSNQVAVIGFVHVNSDTGENANGLVKTVGSISALGSRFTVHIVQFDRHGEV